MIKIGRLHGVPSARHKGTREIPQALGTFRIVGRRRGSAAFSPDRRAAQMIGALDQIGESARSKMFADWTDRIAAGEVPPAPPRPQGIERNVVITQWDWADPKAYLHDEVSTDRRNPTVNANGLDLRLARAERRLPAGARSGAHTREQGAADRPRSEHAADSARRWRRRRRTGATKPSGPARTTCTIRCSTRRAASGSPRPCVRRTTRRSAKQGSSHPSAKLFPLDSVRPPARGLRSEDRKAHAHQHLLQHPPPDVRRGREQHAVDERRRRRWSAG